MKLLNSWRFDSLLEARAIIEDWLRDYNANRPHSVHGELTPAEFALTVVHDPPTESRIRLGHRTGPPQLVGAFTVSIGASSS